jgi:hypothetical protein
VYGELEIHHDVSGPPSRGLSREVVSHQIFICLFPAVFTKLSVLYRYNASLPWTTNIEEQYTLAVEAGTPAPASVSYT